MDDDCQIFLLKDIVYKVKIFQIMKNINCILSITKFWFEYQHQPQYCKARPFLPRGKKGKR